MALLRCQKCGDGITLSVSHREENRIRDIDAPDDKLVGFVECGRCRTRNAFELKAEAITPVASALVTSLSASAPALVRTFYEEAQLCLFSGAARGAAVLCRAAVEEALEAKGFKDWKLEDRINSAKAAGELGDIEYSMANGSRLIGNNAIHQATTVELGLIPLMLSSAAQVVNRLFP